MEAGFATCSMCRRPNCVVRHVFSQATRAEPMRRLGTQGYCPDCDCAFGVSMRDVHKRQQAPKMFDGQLDVDGGEFYARPQMAMEL